VKLESEGISTTFKDQLYSGFQSLYLQKFKQRYGEYLTYIKEAIKNAVKSAVSSVVSVSTGTTVISSGTKIPTYVFTKPFKSNEYNEGIKALQNLLTKLQLYS
jgi:hypothetical protein